MKIELIFGEWFDTVKINGQELLPQRSQEVWNHSPDGFAWGFGGSGPAQLALAILLEAGLSDEDATRYHQQFKQQFLEKLPQKGTTLLFLDVDKWVEHTFVRDTSVLR